MLAIPAVMVAALFIIADMAGLWIDKGLSLVIAGLVPTPQGHIVEYMPTAAELCLGLGIYGFGALVFTGLSQIYLHMRRLEMPSRC